MTHDDLRSDLVKIAFKHMLDERAHGSDAVAIAEASREYVDTMLAEMGNANTLCNEDPPSPPATDTLAVLRKLRERITSVLHSHRLAWGSTKPCDNEVYGYRRGIAVAYETASRWIDEAVYEAEGGEDGGK